MANEVYEQLPNVPETEIIKPIVQCEVLYLGTASPSPNHRGLDSIQEPFSHRYPIDGTNTVQGIDSILSIYKNGIQLTFARQPYVTIFFPLSSFIYCASLRFSIIENDLTSSLDWRFIPLDTNKKHSTKHPPLFALVTQRTKMIAGDECHCFIAKNRDDSVLLVQTISKIYAKFQPNQSSIRSPIFYQLDRYHRKLSETNGMVYLSSVNNDQHSNEYFYRTDGVFIEQWQLWDDEDLNGTRPHPPDSPFGQHQGLYHDDLIEELNEHLRYMDDEEDDDQTCACSYSSTKHHHHRKSRRKTSMHRFQSSLNSSFDPTSIVTKQQQQQQLPIVIEKVLPHVSEQTSPTISYPNSNVTIEPERINSMDIIQVKSSKKKRSKRNHIPVIDIRSIERLFNEKHSDEELLSRSNLLEVIEDYFEAHQGQKFRFDDNQAEKILEELKSQTKNEEKQQQEQPSIITSERTLSYVERSATDNVNHLSQLANPDYIPLFRYMQSSVNPLLFRQYENTFSTN